MKYAQNDNGDRKRQQGKGIIIHSQARQKGHRRISSNKNRLTTRTRR